MSEIWEIKPLIGVGPVLLGMTRNEVAKLEPVLGEIYAYDEINLPTGKTRYKESRDLEAPIITFEDNRVVEINIDWRSRSDIVFNNISVFGDHARNVLSALEAASGGALFGLGLVLFDNLSINTSGFYVAAKTGSGGRYWDDIGDKSIDRTISVCVKDNFKSFLEEYSPISFLK